LTGGGRLIAILDEVTALDYVGGGSRSDDVPSHVRAASAIRRFGSRLAIVQDDVNVLALRDEYGALHPLADMDRPAEPARAAHLRIRNAETFSAGRVR
jgi:hypothetical protein